MEKLTSQIIMMCKQPQNFGEFKTHREAVCVFLELEMGEIFRFYETPKGKEIFNYIIREALFDYIDGVKSPSSILRQIQECMRMSQSFCECYTHQPNSDLYRYYREYDYYDAILSVFSTLQVKEQDKNGQYYYINGFNEENTKLPKPEYFKK